MGEALGQVRKSNLPGATALLRKALSGEGGGRSSDPGGPAVVSPGIPPLRRRRGALGRSSASLAGGRASCRTRPTRPMRQLRRSAHDFDDDSPRATYRGPAGSLNYRLYVPADYEHRDLALVLMLHGCTQNPEDFALGTRMNELADEFGLVVAYPHQSRRANASGCWNWFDKRHQHRGSGEPAKLAGLARALARNSGSGRSGLSSQACRRAERWPRFCGAYPDVFDAVGIHSSLAYKSAIDVPSAFAAMKGAAVVDSASSRPSAISPAAKSSFTAAPTRRSTRSTASVPRTSRGGANPLERSTSIGRPRAGAFAARSPRIPRATGRGALVRRGRRARLVRRRQPRHLYGARRTRRFARHGAVFLETEVGSHCVCCCFERWRP